MTDRIDNVREFLRATPASTWRGDTLQQARSHLEYLLVAVEALETQVWELTGRTARAERVALDAAECMGRLLIERAASERRILS